MQSKFGIEIESVHPGSLTEKAGFLPGDMLLSVNAHRLRDAIDFIYYTSEEILDFELKRNRKKMTLRITRKGNSPIGLTFKPFKILTCRNNCLFCFVRQLPKGLRKTLYIKDEDYRMSFLYGNYMTLSNLTKEDKKRIVEQKLSPLYLSIHSTDRTPRNCACPAAPIDRST